MENIEYGKQILEVEELAVRKVRESLGPSFDQAVSMLLACTSRVIVTGMGKAGLIGEKVSATLASTGTPSHSLHPADAYHGDLGRVVKEDIVLILSNSGETEEIVRLLPLIRRVGAKIVAITGSATSTLAKHGDVVLCMGAIDEACPIGLAPTASTTAMLALGDALAMVVAKARRFTAEEYAAYHPGGSLGRKLLRVSEIMRSGDAITVVATDVAVLDALLRMNRTKGRPGAACVVDDDRRLVGIVTDGDLVRHLEKGPGFLSHPVSEIMGRQPKRIGLDRLATEGLQLLRDHKVDQLPVVDADERPVGLLDIQDLASAGLF
ncbi:MAG: KpsF/GutQ family sugar-phosphate isomerase [Planctomycetes bacterium]|nr:KpsF/GutQ family sugar-phosphate isomerase [Planctomycetota bacterium]MBI3848252.1 KpsF/GutQ family sugar-phosphate isomerase [Planctomycetota bacterium]